MKINSIVLFFVLLLTLGFNSSVFAEPVQWDGEDGNNHWYEVIKIDDLDGITWTEAYAAATGSTWNGLIGNLASITSEDENKFVSNLVNGVDWDSAVYGPWLGATGSAVSDGQDVWVSGNWSWADGETWGYENWASDQPNGVAAVTEGEIYYLHYYPMADTENRTWNDTLEDGYSASRVYGYVVEYAAPVPVPSAFLLLGSGFLCLAGSIRKK
nr:hypothetical protein [uncultured Desulfobacter sp.]